MALPSGVTARLGNVIRRLSSDSDGEIIAAMHVILRLLQSCGGDIHALANHVENGGGLTDADKQKIRVEIENARAIGYAEGVKAAEAKQHGTGAFRNTDGQLEHRSRVIRAARETSSSRQTSRIHRRHGLAHRVRTRANTQSAYVPA
jgi:hypothetical protein